MRILMVRNLKFLGTLLMVFFTIILGISCVGDYPVLSAILVGGGTFALIGLGHMAADMYLPPPTRPKF